MPKWHHCISSSPRYKMQWLSSLVFTPNASGSIIPEDCRMGNLGDRVSIEGCSQLWGKTTTHLMHYWDNLWIAWNPKETSQLLTSRNSYSAISLPFKTHYEWNLIMTVGQRNKLRVCRSQFWSCLIFWSLLWSTKLISRLLVLQSFLTGKVYLIYELYFQSLKHNNLYHDVVICQKRPCI